MIKIDFEGLMQGHSKVLERLYQHDPASFMAMATLAQERLRQIEVESMSPTNDDRLEKGDLEKFSACYLAASVQIPFIFPLRCKIDKPPVELFPRQRLKDKRQDHLEKRLLEIGASTALAALARFYRKN